jgi:hypothetical protein
MSKNNQKLQSVVAMTLGIVFALVISEIILQILDIPPRLVSGWKNCPNKHPGQCNYLGFRGREIHYTPDDFVVLLVGDSEIYAPHLPFDKMPERRLEHFLKKFKKNVKVFTIADMGYGQDQEYLALKEYFKDHRADLVLLKFTYSDDIENNIFPVSGGKDTIKPTFFIKDNKLHSPKEGLLGSIKGYWLKLDLLVKYCLRKQPGKLRLKIWEDDILPPPYKLLSKYQGEVDYSWHEEWKKDPQNAYKGIESEKTGPSNELTPRSERFSYGIKLTRELFSLIKELVETNGGHLILFKEERPYELKYTNEDKVYYLNGRYYKLSMRQYHENLKDIFKDFEHYRIPLYVNNVKTNADNPHLSLEALDEIFRFISLKVSQKKYFMTE